MAFFLAPLLAKLTASAIGKAAIGGVVSAVASNIGRKTTKPSIDLVGMRNDALKAGFNPLTVMRSGGMSGYMIPAMAKQSFAGQMLGGAMTNAFEAWANKDIDAYNAQIRGLELEQRKADLSIAKATIGQMNAPKNDPYAAYGEYIPVRVGNNLQQLDATVARRLNILPNDRVTAGDMEEIQGQFWGGLSGAVGSEIGDKTLIPAPLAGTPTITTTELPEAGPPVLSKEWFEKLNWTLRPSGMVSN